MIAKENDLFSRNGKKVDQHVTDSQRAIFQQGGGCRHCHRGNMERDEATNLWKVENPRIPERWMKHTVFNHQPHRTLDCKKCHHVESSELTADVNLPPIQDCKQCHKSGSPWNTEVPDGAAAARCIDCHRYHHLPHPKMPDENEKFHKWFNDR